MMEWLPTADAAAVIVSVILWVGFELIIEHSRWAPRTLTAAVNGQRQAWMRQAMDRDFRIVDATLFGNLMHSISFLASASLIILGVIGAALGAVGTDMDLIQQKIPFIRPETAAE